MISFDDLFFFRKTQSAIDCEEIHRMKKIIESVPDEESRSLLLTFLRISLKEAFDQGYKTAMSFLLSNPLE